MTNDNDDIVERLELMSCRLMEMEKVPVCTCQYNMLKEMAERYGVEPEEFVCELIERAYFGVGSDGGRA